MEVDQKPTTAAEPTSVGGSALPVVETMVDVQLTVMSHSRQREELDDAEMTVAPEKLTVFSVSKSISGDRDTAILEASAARESIERKGDWMGIRKELTTGDLQTGLSFFQPAEEMDLVKVDITSPDTSRHVQGIVALTMMDFEQQAPVEVSQSLEERAMGSKPEDLGTINPALLSLTVGAGPETPEGPPLTSTDSDQPMTEKDPFQQLLALQEQDMKQQQQEQHDADAEQSYSASSQTTGGFELRRKRNNSVPGKKLQLKKKNSLPNLHGSFQQQGASSDQADSLTMMNRSKSAAGSEQAAAATPSDYVIPPFYFPMGKPVSASKRRQRTHDAMVK